MSTDTPLVLAGDFPPVDAAQWRDAVDRVLAGKDTDLDRATLDERFVRRLVTETYDGIAVQPLYTAADAPDAAAAIGTPGSAPFVRGASLLGGVEGGWDVRQPVELSLADGSSGLALDQLERGATSLLLRAGVPGAARTAGGPASPVDTDLLDAVLDGVHLDLAPVALDPDLGAAGAHALIGLWERRGLDGASVRGSLGLDPVGDAASAGTAVDAEALQVATDLTRRVAEHFPLARTLVVDATRYHEAGASDADELACATATGVTLLRVLTGAGLDLATAFGQLEFRLAATADQFSTLAKFRAARRLWARVAAVLDTPDLGVQHQHAVTSRAMLTRYDPWVNLLRNAVACFAAGAGGAEAVTVEPHDLLVGESGPTELGRRMARNTQLLLLEETHLGRILDPGGGSWYVEWLTDALARRAWEGLQQIEAAGGMAAALASRLVQDRIEATWAERESAVAHRVDTIVGVSDFPTIDDQVPPPPPRAEVPVGGLPRRRLAEPVEALRARVDAHLRATGTRPAVLLVQLGTAAEYTARATYAKAFFETGGLRTVTHEVAAGTEPGTGALGDALRAAASGEGVQLACLCSSDARYAEDGASAAGAVAGAGLARSYVAGRPGGLGEGLLAAGADELVYAGCDVLDVLRRALDTIGVAL